MLNARIDPNVEIATCLFNLTERGSSDWNAGMPSQPFRQVVMERFAPLRQHPAVALANQLHGGVRMAKARRIGMRLVYGLVFLFVLACPLYASSYTDLFKNASPAIHIVVAIDSDGNLNGLGTGFILARLSKTICRDRTSNTTT